jgi:urease accessory protein UreH
MEPTEIHEFSNQLKEANEEGGESLRTISLAISVLAVFVAMVTVLGHRSHTNAILMQSRAADQWSQYQSKKIRMDNYIVTSDVLASQPSINPAATAARIAEYKIHINKWEHELTDEEAVAEKYEEKVEHSEHQAARYDLGEALLQIAVVLSSITLFTRNHRYFMLGLGIGATGLIIAATGLFAR